MQIITVCGHLFNSNYLKTMKKEITRKSLQTQLDAFLELNSFKSQRWITMIGWCYWILEFSNYLIYNIYANMSWLLSYLISWISDQIDKLSFILKWLFKCHTWSNQPCIRGNIGWVCDTRENYITEIESEWIRNTVKNKIWLDASCLPNCIFFFSIY